MKRFIRKHPVLAVSIAFILGAFLEGGKLFGGWTSTSYGESQTLGHYTTDVYGNVISADGCFEHMLGSNVNSD